MQWFEKLNCETRTDGAIVEANKKYEKAPQETSEKRKRIVFHFERNFTESIYIRLFCY